MVEFPGRIFPVDEIVALQAILPEPPLVKVFVAGYARLRNPQEGLAEVLHFYIGALGGRDSIGKVALVAGQTGMFAFQQISGFLVVKLVRIPLDQREIRPIVIGVAADAFLAGAGQNVIGPVQPALGGDSRANIGVAADAFELRLAAAELVAVGAVGGSVEKLMWLRQRAGRNLRRGGSGEPEHHRHLQQEKQE